MDEMHITNFSYGVYMNGEMSDKQAMIYMVPTLVLWS